MTHAGTSNPPGAREALYAAFVLVLVLGLRRGEVLGLAWHQIDLDNGRSLERNRPLTWVGDTGIEPVTSSVRTSGTAVDHGR